MELTFLTFEKNTPKLHRAIIDNISRLYFHMGYFCMHSIKSEIKYQKVHVINKN